MEIDLGKVKAERGMSDTEILYSESASRIVIEVVPEKRKAVMDLFGRDAVCIGSSSQAPVLFIRSKSGQPIVSEAVADLKAAWKKTLDF